mmetsp:Transcript_4271/g.15967  ORF Transcript_4271/g.15967 Transcript_4271/m.15967 type:complete len:202 (+) Transcript_4271:7738-8343(+)
MSLLPQHDVDRFHRPTQTGSNFGGNWPSRRCLQREYLTSMVPEGALSFARSEISENISLSMRSTKFTLALVSGKATRSTMSVESVFPGKPSKPAGDTRARSCAASTVTMVNGKVWPPKVPNNCSKVSAASCCVLRWIISSLLRLLSNIFMRSRSTVDSRDIITTDSKSWPAILVARGRALMFAFGRSNCPCKASNVSATCR